MNDDNNQFSLMRVASKANSYQFRFLTSDAKTWRRGAGWF